MLPLALWRTFRAKSSRMKKEGKSDRFISLIQIQHSDLIIGKISSKTRIIYYTVASGYST